MSPLAELTAVLHASAGPVHHSPGLVDRLREQTSASVWREMTKMSTLWSGYRARFLLPMNVDTPSTLEEEVDRILRLPLPVFLEAAAWAVRGGHTGSPPRADLVANSRARQAVVTRAQARGSPTFEMATQLFDDPGRFRERIVQLVYDVAASGVGVEAERSAQQRTADCVDRQHLLRNRGAAAVLASLSSANQVLAAPLRVRIDKVHHGYVQLTDHKPVLLVPSVIGRPHLLTKDEPGWLPLVQYPIGLSPAAIPSLQVIRERLVVLSEPTRLRLCRLIAREPASTSDLAARTGMSAPQVSRHLRRLRDVGMVHYHREGRAVVYELDLGSLRSLGPDILTSLLR